MKLCFIFLFILLSTVTVNANSTVEQSENFDSCVYLCDYANSTTSSNEIGPFTDNSDIFSVLWQAKKSTGTVVSPGIVTVSTQLSPFNITKSLKQFASTKIGFLNMDKPTGMSVVINKQTPLNQKVLMEANYLFTEAKFNKTVFYAKSIYTYSGQVQQPFKITFSNDGMLKVYSGNGSDVVNSVPWEINKWYHVALLVDMQGSTISVYVNGEILKENSHFTPQSDTTKRTIGQIFLSTITGLVDALDSDKSTVFIDDVKVTSGDSITYDTLNSNANILSATFYEIDNLALKIKQVPKSTTVANFKSNIKLAQNTALNVYDENGLLLSDISEITETTIAVVTAPNSVTKKMYNVGIIPNPEFRVDGQIIKNITDAYGKTLNASVDVINDEAEYPLMAILALYDINGKLITSSVSPQKKAQIGTTTFATSINVEIPYKAKFMLWNALQPIREVTILQ